MNLILNLSMKLKMVLYFLRWRLFMSNRYPRVAGIYLIRRKNVEKTDKPEFYIGKSNRVHGGIFMRLNEHVRHFAPTQRIDIDIKKHGVINFTFEILEVLSGRNKQIDEREQFWIREYINKYGETKLYNMTLGGVKGSTRVNVTHSKVDSSLRKQINEIFEKEIDFSIYLIAEKFDLLWSEVVNIRKPIIIKKNLRYDTRKKHFVDSITGKLVLPWNGYRLTKSQVHIYEQYKEKLDIPELVNFMNVSVTDLQDYFIPEYKLGKYQTAEETCEISLLS